MSYYCILDRAAGSVLGVWFPARTDAEAWRQFQGLRGDSETVVGKFPDDFELWCACSASVSDDGVLVISGTPYEVVIK